MSRPKPHRVQLVAVRLTFKPPVWVSIDALDPGDAIDGIECNCDDMSTVSLAVAEAVADGSAEIASVDCGEVECDE